MCKIKIIECNSNNTIYFYPVKEVQAAIDKINKSSDMIYGGIGFLGYRDDIKVCDMTHGITGFVIENDILYANIKILDTPRGDTLREMMSNPDFNKEYSFSPIFHGTLHKDMSISNISIKHINCVKTSEVDTR